MRKADNGRYPAGRAICVLGMHRSGTSTMTRAINLLGAYLGEGKELGGPAPDNPEGFWERWDINSLDERILNSYKRNWDTTLPMPPGWHRSPEAVSLRAEAAALMRKAFSGRELWAWKDPRTTLLFELWRDAAAEAGAQLACLFAVRNPLDVARSLQKRNGFDTDRSFGIWFNYNIAALLSSNGLPRSFISYDAFLADWEKELKRCSSELSIEWPRDDSGLRDEMTRFIRPGLRHSSSGAADLKKAGAPGPVVRLYEMLDKACSSAVKTDEAFHEAVRAMSAEFNSWARLFRSDVEECWNAKRRLRRITKSWSWKTTAPFRAVMDAFKK